MSKRRIAHLIQHMQKLNEHRSSANDLHSRLACVMKTLCRNPYITEFNRELIRTYVEALRHKGDAPATINAKLCALKAALKEAHQMGWIDKVPEVKLEKIREKVKAVLSDDEVDRLLLEANGNVYDVVTFYLKTGCRANELIEAVSTWSGQRKLELMHTKNGCVRSIELDDHTMNALTALQYKHELKSFDYKEIYSMWNTLMNDLGWQDKGYTLHTLRHTVATRLARAGIPVQDICSFLGHKDIKTTMRYIHAEVDHKSIMSVL